MTDAQIVITLAHDAQSAEVDIDFGGDSTLLGYSVTADITGMRIVPHNTATPPQPQPFTVVDELVRTAVKVVQGLLDAREAK